MRVHSWPEWPTRTGPTGKFLDEDVEVELISEQASKVYIYTEFANTASSIIKVYQFLMDLFPKAIINIDFSGTFGKTVSQIMKLAKVDEVETGINGYDSAIQAALNECANTRRLRINKENSNGIRINPEARFDLDYVYIKDADGWIDKQQLVRNFLNCKQVILPRTSFGLLKDDYPEFVKSWMKGSKMELLKIGGRWIDQYRIADTVGILPGAVEVRRARVWEDKEDSEDRVLKAGRCYMVQQADGTRAIVVWSRRELLLTTKFEILEEAKKRTAE